MEYNEWKEKVFKIAEKIDPGEGKKLVKDSGEELLKEAFFDNVSPDDFYREGYCEE